MSDVRVGQFVRSQENTLGVGKVVRREGTTVEVEYFDSIADDGRTIVELPARAVERTQISLQRRCYWLENDRWRVGRVVWQSEDQYGVRVPDSDLDVRVAEDELFVRWDRPIGDPTAVLIAYGNESPHFHSCRQPFVASIAQQRAASRGMHGLLSSVVEVHNHQVEVVRRVLEDPRPRYLLADEVGLGKTIEAGLVIRQYLLDNPAGHVLVIAPPLLRRQWVAELREKFLIDDFEDAVISILSHDNPDSWLGNAADGHGRSRSHRNSGLVVVDEVHNLAALYGSQGQTSQPYERLVELTSAVPRLLLLSATPLLNNELTFLAMLHLLDPEVYRLDDLEGFRQRVRDRRGLANAFFTFNSDAPAFLLKEKLETLRQMFTSDNHLEGLLDAVAGRLAEGASPEVLIKSVAAVRTHISETYRLHRRLLRTRRTETLLRTFPVRGRSRPETIPVPGGASAASLDWLNDWRDYSRASLAEDADDAQRASATRAFVAFADRAASNVELLAAAARFRLYPTLEAAAAAELAGDEQVALQSREVADEERAILERAQDLSAEDEGTRAISASLRKSSRRTVIFTSYTKTAKFLGDRLSADFGDEAIAMHITSDSPGDVETALDRFRNPDDPCRVLVCDRSAEEGRNLQFADAAMHFDLPLWPNRLEQRIGRLDRYGRGERIPSESLQYPSGSIPDSWAQCLHEGFGVFDESIASLQFTVDELLPKLHAALFDNGPAALDGEVAQLPSLLGSERLAVAEQDALDAVETASYDVPLAVALDDVEDLWFQHQVAAEGLLTERHGNLRFHRAIDRSDERFRSYKLTRPGKGASLNSMPLVAWDVLLSRFRSVVDHIGTYSRRSAVGRPGSRLFRVGEPLIDALSDYVRWDDRGQTFALWRLWAGAGDDAAFFRFDYMVEADTGTAASEVADEVGTDLHALQRRADGFLAPTARVAWTDLDGEAVNDASLLAVLEAPYEPGQTDFNLNAERRWALDQLVGSGDWPERCRSARRASEEALRISPDFVDASTEACRDFEAASFQSHLQRELRLAQLDTRQRSSEAAELARTRSLDDAIVLGMREPSVRLDSVGCIVLSRSVPEGPGFTRGRG